ELAAFSSAIILGLIALGIGYESLMRLIYPVAIHVREAIPIAALGLCVNLASAWLLRDRHDEFHHHGHGHAHQSHHDHSHHDHGPQDHSHDDHDHAHHDHGHHDHAHAPRAQHGHGTHGDDTNFKAAYTHVLADALISVLTILALSAAWAFGWAFMDPLVGL